LNQTSVRWSKTGMKRSRIIVPWPEGLHLRPAAKLVRVAQGFRSTISLKRGDKIADLRSILSILALCATLGTALDLEAAGDDEQHAVEAVKRVFSSIDTQMDQVDPTQ
jgi:phosphotransferase system HPr (HPr) family protein